MCPQSLFHSAAGLVYVTTIEDKLFQCLIDGCSGPYQIMGNNTTIQEFTKELTWATPPEVKNKISYLREVIKNLEEKLYKP